MLFQLCCLRLYANKGRNLGDSRTSILEWIKLHRNTAVLVVLEGHSAIETGEIVYAPPGSQENKYSSIDKVWRII